MLHAKMSMIPAGDEYDSDDDDFSYPSHDDAHLGLPSASSDLQGQWPPAGPLPPGAAPSALYNGGAMVQPVFFSSGRSVEDFRLAAMRGQTDILQQCLDQGMAVDTEFHDHWTVLMHAAKAAQLQAVHLLLAAGANVNHHADKVTPLLAACSPASSSEETEVVECVSALIEAGADINVNDRRHQTPLMFAAMDGRVGVVRCLLEHGVDPNKQDGAGWTALTWAVSRKQKLVIRVLVTAGADQKKQHADGSLLEDVAVNFDPEELQQLLQVTPASESDPLLEALQAAGDAGPDRSPVSFYSLRQDCGRQMGEMELFLQGLKLEKLMPLFSHHSIDFSVFLTLTEDDLVKIGIDKVGVRKVLLQSIQTLNKQVWDKDSLVSFGNGRAFQCGDALAMMANIARHLSYIGGSVHFLHSQLVQNSGLLQDSANGTGPSQLVRHSLEAESMVVKLQQELLKLNSCLAQELQRPGLDPPDILKRRNAGQRRWRWGLGLSVATAAVAAVVVWQHPPFSRSFPFK